MNKTSRTNTPIYLLVSGGVLLIIVASILVSQNSGGEATPKPTTLADSHEEETYPEIPRIRLEEAKAALDEGTVVFLDVRDADLYAAGHLPGALNIPLASFSHVWTNWIMPFGFSPTALDRVRNSVPVRRASCLITVFKT